MLTSPPALTVPTVVTDTVGTTLSKLCQPWRCSLLSSTPSCAVDSSGMLTLLSVVLFCESDPPQPVSARHASACATTRAAGFI
jgi:hypothetical protein